MQPVSLVILILVWLIFVTIQISQRAFTEVRFRQMEGKEIWYEFDENGFRCGLPNAEGQYNWPAISSSVETDALFVVQAGLLFYTIPKRALAADQVISLRQLLLQKVATKGS
jgi:hypothetical protein